MGQDSYEACAPKFWPIVGPSFIIRVPWDDVKTVDGLALELLGPSGPEERFFDLYPFAGKESWSAREGETSDATLVGKDTNCVHISRDMT